MQGPGWQLHAGAAAASRVLCMPSMPHAVPHAAPTVQGPSCVLMRLTSPVLRIHSAPSFLCLQELGMPISSLQAWLAINGEQRQHSGGTQASRFLRTMLLRCGFSGARHPLPHLSMPFFAALHHKGLLTPHSSLIRLPVASPDDVPPLKCPPAHVSPCSCVPLLMCPPRAALLRGVVQDRRGLVPLLPATLARYLRGPALAGPGGATVRRRAAPRCAARAAACLR